MTARHNFRRLAPNMLPSLQGFAGPRHRLTGIAGKLVPSHRGTAERFDVIR